MTLLGVSVARGFFTLVQNYYSESVGHHVGYELRLAFYDKVQRLSYSYHDKVHTGDLITMGLLDLDGVRMFFATGLVRMVLLSVLIGVGAYMLLTTDLRAGPAGAELRALRRLALVGGAADPARHLDHAAGEALGADPGDGRKSRRHPRRPRLFRRRISNSTSSTRPPRRRWRWRMIASISACATPAP